MERSDDRIEIPDPEISAAEAVAEAEQLDLSGGRERPLEEKGETVGPADRHESEAGREEVEALEREVEELRDRSRRALADFENYRKRVARERVDEGRYAGFEVLRDLLPVVDNLERALASGGAAVDDLKAGVEMILRQIGEIQHRFGVDRISAVDQPFDPNFHEAVARVEDPEVSEAVVKEELQAGFTMHDRLIRPAIVKVAVPPEDGTRVSDSQES